MEKLDMVEIIDMNSIALKASEMSAYETQVPLIIR